MVRKWRVCRIAAIFSMMALPAVAAPAPVGQAAQLTALARMPIREVTIFKDGHAFVLHEGTMPTDDEGNVLMDYLPAPVLGTFWAHSAENKAKLTAVVASPHRVRLDRTALNVRDLIEANIGAQVSVTEMPTGRETQSITYSATVLEVPERSGEELEKTSPPNSGEKLPQKGSVVLLKTDGGIKAVPFDRIVDVTFKDTPKRQSGYEEFRNLLTLKLDWEDRKAGKEALVGMMYLQRGLRWIPGYKVALDGKGNAVIKLEATLINELADMEDVTAQLVVGVPTFAFKDLIDPISLQQVMARLSPYFDQNAISASRLSNALMSQTAAPAINEGREESGRAPTADLGPEIAGSQRNEDLFIYSVKHVTLKKGQRMVLPVHEIALRYRDIYTIEIPFALPSEIRRDEMGLSDEQHRELARLMREPKAIHKIRLSNKSSYPLTTAPALILLDDKVMAQGLITYTSIGAEGDLPVTQAVDINLKKTDKELKRLPNAETWQGRQYGRIDLAGSLTVTNRRDRPAELEIVRYVLGNLTEAGNGGKIEMVNTLEDRAAGDVLPQWWPWSAWPDWWFHFNGVGKVTWNLTLEAGKTSELTYAWNYYWR